MKVPEFVHQKTSEFEEVDSKPDKGKKLSKMAQMKAKLADTIYSAFEDHDMRREILLKA